MELWGPTEGGAVAAGERVGKVGDGAAVEGGDVAGGEWCMGRQQRRGVEREDESDGYNGGGDGGRRQGQHGLLFFCGGSPMNYGAVLLNFKRSEKKRKEKKNMKMDLFDLDFDKV